MRVGDTIAGYEIVAKLKSGGMASLYLGRRQGAAGFAKHVAIKVVHDHLAEDEGFVKMFLDEARITARIEHPNVVHVHDLGMANGHYFLVMEYVPSVSLTQLMRAVAKLGRRLSPEVATWIAMQIAAGLHAAHETTDDDGSPLHVVHRDVSPKNVLLAFKGYVKVIDFGIAKAAGRATKTTGGMLKGTFRYMSPEQARGREIDHRSDLYTLGIVLWEMLVMRRLFDADNDLALLDMVREPEVVAPGRLISLPPALDRVVMKALSRKVDDRPANCDELRMMLSSAVPGALRITAKQIAELIGASMADEVDPEVEPSVASALGKPVTVQVPTDVLEAMTRTPEAILVDGSAALQPSPIIVTPTGQVVDPRSGVVPTMVTPTPSHPGFDDAATIEADTIEADTIKPDKPDAAPHEALPLPATMPELEIDVVDTIPAPRRRASPAMLIGVVATVVVLLGAGITWAVSSNSEQVELAEPADQVEAIDEPIDEPIGAPIDEPVEEVAEPAIQAALPQTPEEASEAASEVVEEPIAGRAEPQEAPEQAATATPTMRRERDRRDTARDSMRRRSSMSNDPLVVGW